MQDFTGMQNLVDQQTYQKVRLKPAAVDAIVHAFKENFAVTDHLWIFGSRVILTARGGDIDLYIETQEQDVEKVYMQKNKFVSGIWDQIGEQRIDVVVKFVNDDFEIPIYKVAIKNGVKLV